MNTAVYIPGGYLTRVDRPPLPPLVWRFYVRVRGRIEAGAGAGVRGLGLPSLVGRFYVSHRVGVGVGLG